MKKFARTSTIHLKNIFTRTFSEVDQIICNERFSLQQKLNILNVKVLGKGVLKVVRVA